jgi:hypothetical protein
VSRARVSAGPNAAHDPLFSADVRRAFCARLRGDGLDYGTVADELGRLGVPRPSAGSGTWRALIVATARMSSGDALRCAETAARLYDARRHSQSAPPADDDGYLSALTDAPALCAAPGRALAACCATTTTTSETCALVWSVCVVEYRASDCSDPAGGDL